MSAKAAMAGSKDGTETSEGADVNSKVLLILELEPGGGEFQAEACCGG